MKTYLLVTFSSEGASLYEVRDRLMQIGPKAVKRNLEVLLMLADKIHTALRGMSILFP